MQITKDLSPELELRRQIQRVCFSSRDLPQLSAFRKKCAVVQVSEGAVQKTKADGEKSQGRLLDGKTVGAIHNRQNFGDEIDEPEGGSSHDGHQQHNGLSE
jgi:hypothetical protein